MHPAAIAFYEAHGVELGYEMNEFEQIKQFWQLMTAQEQKLLSTDPPRVRVTIRYAGDALCLTVNDAMTVVDLDEERQDTGDVEGALD